MVGETFVRYFPEIARIVFKLSPIIREIYESKLPQMPRKAFKSSTMAEKKSYFLQMLLNQSGSSPGKTDIQTKKVLIK